MAANNPVDTAEALIERGGAVHLAGIGGIGMAGLALLLQARGLRVDGCDLAENRHVEQLRAAGIPVQSGHSTQHLSPEVEWVVRSTAVPEQHPEIQEALARGLPVLRRGEVLPALLRRRTAIAVCGTHGKTPTTAFIAQLLGCGYFVGGEVEGQEQVAQDAPLMVVEADESDGTLVGYTPDYAVITNIEYDHMEHHASAEAFLACFERLVEQTKVRVFYAERDPLCRKICAGREHCTPFRPPEDPFDLPLPGEHNQWNAAAAAAVCSLWMEASAIREGLKRVRAVRRRFETVMNRGGVRVILDYAHHPTEVRALLRTARSLCSGRLLVLFQPHRYTRTRALGSDFPPAFSEADLLWIAPVYAASEPPMPGGHAEDLARRFPSSWTGRLFLPQSLEASWADIQRHLRPGDCLLLVGAGDVEKVAEWVKNAEIDFS
jgi:UDP-N-acetylmuramate--alanine ligase